MKHFFILAMLLVTIGTSTVLAKKTDEGLAPEYQLEGAGMTSQNAQQVKITIITKKKDNVSESDLERAAVHGVLFRDYDDATNSGFGSVASHKSIMSSPTAEAEYIDFFAPFFKDGQYKKYVQIVSDSRRIVKSGKEWKVSAIVRVNTAALKKDLKAQGIYKDLGGGW